ncbi:MAG: pyrroline-5-carboxylate reductase [Gammaproteobacteria bacterium]|nr:pyrroline-5-carboxylate reductase [Gammaproteobacteria bacterium]TVQ50172.1 MAG: pyrroline-5-carboxylate reductase [Gammaproteobacteria bacterium]
MTRTPDIGFIGAGNMARSLIGGLLAQGYPPERLHAADPGLEARDATAALGIEVTADNRALAGAVEVLVLAVKPQVLAEVAGEIASTVRRTRPLVLSIAAGMPLAALGRLFGDVDLAMVRAMPNTPALLGCGASGLYANAACSVAQREQAEQILAAAGLVAWLEHEALIDVVTAVSGSGPAYFFRLIELLGEIGSELGLPPGTAQALARQTALGAARMATESGLAPDELRRRVTSPGGTTEAALASLDDSGIRAMFSRALQAAQTRARELGSGDKD